MAVKKNLQKGGLRMRQVVAAALADPKVQKFTEGKNLVKTILVKNKLVNLIAK